MCTLWMILVQNKQHRQKEAAKRVNIRDAPVDWPSVRTRHVFAPNTQQDFFFPSILCSKLAYALESFPRDCNRNITKSVNRMLTERRDTLKMDTNTRAQTPQHRQY